MAIWGSMCGAETDMWNAHFDSLLDVPGHLLKRLPEPVADRFDPRVADSEQTRSRLVMMTNFLNLRANSDMSTVLER